MRNITIFAATLAVLLALAAPARAGMEEDCVQEYDPDLRISGCTAMIRSGQYPNWILVVAYNNRGIAYAHLDKYRLAIQDYDQALRLDPDDASVYHNRGVSYKSVGEYERTVGDWEQLIRIDGAPRAKRWQTYLKGKGHYAGAIDGIFGLGTRRGLVACARDPNC